MTANQTTIASDVTSIQYPNAPVIEAVCEIRLARDRPWTQSLVGLLYAELKREFPLERTMDAMSADFEVGATTVTQRMHPLLVTQFVREDEQALVQIAPGLLSVNQLPPYPGWPTFRVLIEYVLDVYRRIVIPESVIRLGLRYVNRIVLPEARIDLEKYFDFYPRIGVAFPDLLTNFAVMVEFPHEDHRDILRVQHSGVVTGDLDQRTTLLDLDYFLRAPGSIELDEIATWLETAHAHVEDSFKAAVTPELRTLFGDEGVRGDERA